VLGDVADTIKTPQQAIDHVQRVLSALAALPADYDVVLDVKGQGFGSGRSDKDKYVTWTSEYYRAFATALQLLGSTPVTVALATGAPRLVPLAQSGAIGSAWIGTVGGLRAMLTVLVKRAATPPPTSAAATQSPPRWRRFLWPVAAVGGVGLLVAVLRRRR
jgi:hypothetical protein